MNEETIHYDPFDRMNFSDNNCFICGIELDQSNKTVEHVFPKWLQEKFNLWDKRLTLLNGTQIPYRMLKIPCCIKCNGSYLSNVENIIKEGLEQGYDCFVNIDKKIIFQWLSKIFYGLLFKELSLDFDRKDSSIGTITTPELLKDYKMMHVFLQSVRYPTEFEGFNPWSIHILQGQEFEEVSNFNYIDGLHSLTFSINLGTIMIFAHLQDNGAHQIAKSKYFNDLKIEKLHNIQFIELAAKTVYSSYLLNHNPTYMTVSSIDNDELFQVISLSSYFDFDEWDEKVYGQLLHRFLSHTYDITFEAVYSSKYQKAVTFIRNEDGSFNNIPSKARMMFSDIK